MVSTGPRTPIPIDAQVRMANQIGAFFEAMPDRTASLAGISQHLARYREPRMRRELLEHLQIHGSAGLNDRVAEARGCRAGERAGQRRG